MSTSPLSHARMDSVVVLKRLPENFSAFVEEIATGLSGLYGPGAGDEYRQIARTHFESTLAHPDVTALGYAHGKTIGALLLAVDRGEYAQIPFLHVLQSFSGLGGERLLLREAVHRKRKSGKRAIISEFAAFGQIEVDEEFSELGFEAVDRVVMSARLTDNNAHRSTTPHTEALEFAQWNEAAGVLVDAYREHPGKRLHLEVWTKQGACGFLSSVVRGSFGETRPEFVRIARQNGEVAGLIAGCRMAPGVGFVLHVAVRPPYQRQGLGEALLAELGAVFRAKGYDRMALGVTVDNPAMRLYKRLGFQPLRPIRSYFWWDDMPLSG